MNDDTYTYSDGPSTDNYGIEPPPRERPRDDEIAYDGPTYDSSARERHRPPLYVRWIGGGLIVCALLLLVCGGTTAVLAVITLNSTPASAAVDKTFTVSGAPTLIIHSAVGTVHVNPGAGDQITLHATKQARALTHAQAQSDLDNITITTTQTGNVVNIQVDGTNGGGLVLFNSLRIDLNVTTPANTSLSVVEDAGTLDASGLTGKLTAQVNAGSMTLDDMTMATGSSLHVNAGSLSVDGALQPGASLLVEVNAGSADVTLPHNTNAHVDATASAGSVDVNGWNISVNDNGPNSTASGDLNPNSTGPKGTITIRVSAGSASLNAA
ncbi:MAG TPA: DUF4097 family beta strand repeat-containing protein [Ktedonobacterales bacterium]|nr:DUF4097 family beta strand repeat-containing protein [Ktedonobacterales bacterium]